MIETEATPDTQVLLLLCSTLGLSRDVKPLTLTEWNGVATALHRESLEPAALLELSPDECARRLGVPATLAARMGQLLARGGQLSLEIERLHSRGIWVLTRVDAEYPRRLRDRLKGQAPAVLCGAGPKPAGDSPSVAIVGSRDADDRALQFTRDLAAACAAHGVAVVSGGARGVDLAAQEAALEHGGAVYAVLADSLEKALQKRALREQVRQGALTLMTIVHPAAPFSAGVAMGRNKVVYALSSAAVVVSSGEGSGGTWAGATENLQRTWVPLLVRAGDDVPSGNRGLIAKGAIAVADGADGIGDVLRVAGAVGSPARAVVYAHAPDPGPAAVAEAAPSYVVTSPAPVIEPATNGAVDTFALVADRLHAFCEAPRSPADIAVAFHLENAQVDAWLTRAVSEGLLRKLNKPVRYQGVERTLFDA